MNRSCQSIELSNQTRYPSSATVRDHVDRSPSPLVVPNPALALPELLGLGSNNNTFRGGEPSPHPQNSASSVITQANPGRTAAAVLHLQLLVGKHSITYNNPLLLSSPGLPPAPSKG
ncbi:unnamed protein product [Boreogadus saida]